MSGGALSRPEALIRHLTIAPASRPNAEIPTAQRSRTSSLAPALAHQCGGNEVDSGCGAIDQGGVAENVDGARNASARARDHTTSLAREQRRLGARGSQALVDILTDLAGAQCLE